MKWMLILGLISSLVTAARAADQFWGQLTPAERHAAGLDKLSPEQQAVLDQLAARYAGLASTESNPAVAISVTQSKAAKVTKSEEANFGLVKPKSGPDAIRSQIDGTFKGWSGRTLFRLQNGQTWVQADPSANYWVPDAESPEVEIQSSVIGGWKLYILPERRWVRVKRVN